MMKAWKDEPNTRDYNSPFNNSLPRPRQCLLKNRKTINIKAPNRLVGVTPSNDDRLVLFSGSCSEAGFCLLFLLVMRVVVP
jgi:hypothetical protein